PPMRALVVREAVAAALVPVGAGIALIPRPLVCGGEAVGPLAARAGEVARVLARRGPQGGSAAGVREPHPVNQVLVVSVVHGVSPRKWIAPSIHLGAHRVDALFVVLVVVVHL